MDLNKFKNRFDTDTEKEVKGIEVHLGEGFYVKVARSGNLNAQRKAQELASSPDFMLARKAGTLEQKELDHIGMEVYAATILVGWRGLTEGEKEIPYSVEKARELLGIRDFFNAIREIAETQENYRRAAVEEATKILGES